MLNFLGSGDRSATPDQPGRGHLGLRIAPDVKASLHAEGIVLLHLGKGTVFSANRAGATIWSGVAERWSLDRVAETIGSEFHVPAQGAREDAAEFLAQLVAEGLLVTDVG